MAACKGEVPPTSNTSLGGSRWPDPVVSIQSAFEINIQARCLQQKNDDENEDLHEKN